MPVDIILYALVAGGLVLWLRSILGTRHGEERHRPLILKDSNTENTSTDKSAFISQEELIANFQDEKGVMAINHNQANGGLLEIAKIDKSFDVKTFLTAAQDAFAIVVESFADGDRETLKDLLSPQVYSAFDSVITQREQQQEKQKTDILAIRKAEIIEAKHEGKMGFIGVRFLAEETSVTFNAQGNMIAGHPDKVSIMRDIWVFGRDLKSKDPRWLVYETRSEAEGDNDFVPNAH